jgi:predicted ATPase
MLRLSLPPGLADAFPYQIIPRTARTIPIEDYLKVQALLAEEEKPKGQNEHGLHVAQDLEGYSGEPPNADELAQIDTDGDEA